MQIYTIPDAKITLKHYILSSGAPVAVLDRLEWSGRNAQQRAHDMIIIIIL